MTAKVKISKLAGAFVDLLTDQIQKLLFVLRQAHSLYNILQQRHDAKPLLDMLPYLPDDLEDRSTVRSANILSGAVLHFIRGGRAP